MSYSEVHSLPIRYRRWYLDRLMRHFKEKNESYEKTKNNSKNSNTTNNVDMFSRFEQQVKNKLT